VATACRQSGLAAPTWLQGGGETGQLKHPRSLGQRGRDCWAEIWHIIGPMLEGVRSRGEATWSDDQMLPLHRLGFTEGCYFTFTYSPIRDESGDVAGVFCAVMETTERVLADSTLRQSGQRLNAALDLAQSSHRQVEGLLDAARSASTSSTRTCASVRRTRPRASRSAPARSSGAISPRRSNAPGRRRTRTRSSPCSGTRSRPACAT
jgi:hypothetical protein